MLVDKRSSSKSRAPAAASATGASKTQRVSKKRSERLATSAPASAPSAPTSNDPIAYATDFVSFLIQMMAPAERRMVRRVLLFGSAARGELQADSDIDLFIDTDHARRLEPRIRTLTARFDTSVKVQKYWRLLGVGVPFSVHVAELASWSSLHPALLKDGLVLYGPYTEHTPTLGPARALIFWGDIHDAVTRTNLYRSLYGYKSRGRRYPGQLERHHAETISKGSALVPLSTLGAFQALFRKLRVPLKVRVLYEPASAPGRAATLEQMLNMAAIVAEHDTEDGFDTQYVPAASPKRGTKRKS